MYVAVNESKRSHSFAKKAALVAVSAISSVSINAETINSSFTISNSVNYDSLDLSGSFSSKAEYKTEAYDYYKNKVDDVSPPQTDAGYQDPFMEQYFYWPMIGGYGPDYYLHNHALISDYKEAVDDQGAYLRIPDELNIDLKNVEIKIDETGKLSVKNDIKLGTNLTTVDLTLWIAGRVYVNEGDNGHYHKIVVSTGNLPAKGYTYSKILNLGSVVASNIVFESKENTYEQQSGSTSIKQFIGGGQAVFSGGTLNVDNLTGAIFTASDSFINASEIDLQKYILTSTDSTLET